MPAEISHLMILDSGQTLASFFTIEVVTPLCLLCYETCLKQTALSCTFMLLLLAIDLSISLISLWQLAPAGCLYVKLVSCIMD